MAMRWSGNTMRECIPTGSMRGAFSIGGLLLWSCGFPYVTYKIINRRKSELSTPFMVRNYGYFYAGFEPDYWYWELLCKRVDCLIVLGITFTNLVPDAKAKLILYMVCAGIWWAIHNECHPYDCRQNGLLDKAEAMGLQARFLTFFVVTVLLIFAAPMPVALVGALFLCYLLGKFVLFVLLVIGGEMVAAGDKPKAPGGEGEEEEGGGGCDPKAILKKIGKKIANSVGKIVMAILLKGVEIIQKEKAIMAKEVPHFQRQGPGKPLQIVKCEKEVGEPGAPRVGALGYPRRALRVFVSSLYALGYRTQTSYGANAFTKITDHLVGNMGFLQIPSQLVDIIALFTLALKHLSGEGKAVSKFKKVLIGRNKGAKMTELDEIEQMIELLSSAFIDDALAAGGGGAPRKAKMVAYKSVTLGEVSMKSAGEDFIFNSEDTNNTVMKIFSFDQLRSRRIINFAHDIIVSMREELEPKPEEPAAVEAPAPAPAPASGGKRDMGLPAEPRSDPPSAGILATLKTEPYIPSSGTQLAYLRVSMKNPNNGS